MSNLKLLLAPLTLSACAQMAAALKPTPTLSEVPPAPPIQSELHRANVGKVVFAHQKIESDATSAALITQATLAETVEVRAYFATTPALALRALRAAECSMSSYHLVWEMRDAQDAEWTALSSMYLGLPLAEGWTTTRIEPLWGPERTWPKISSEDEKLSALLHAKQQASSVPLELKVSATCQLEGTDETLVATMATGTLAVAVSPASVRSYAERTFGKPQHLFEHAQDFKYIEAEARRVWGTDGAQVLWVRVPQREWTIVRGKLGEILFRGATVTTAVRTTTGCAIKTAIARENAMGGGRFVTVPQLVDATNEFPETTTMPCSVL